MLRRYQVYCSGPDRSETRSVEAESRQQALDWARQAYPGCQCAAVDAALVDLAKSGRPPAPGEL
jgi:hypothetical protein